MNNDQEIAKRVKAKLASNILMLGAYGGKLLHRIKIGLLTECLVANFSVYDQITDLMIEFEDKYRDSIDDCASVMIQFLEEKTQQNPETIEFLKQIGVFE